MKKLILAATLALPCSHLIAQTRADYENVLGKFRNFYNHVETDSIYSLLSERSKSLMPLSQTQETFKKLYTQLGNIKSFEFSKEQDGVSFYKTDFDKATLSLILSLNNDHKLESFRFMPYMPATAPDDKSQVTLKTPTGDIHGTLTLPDITNKPVPVVLIIAGSGPTDRDGNNMLGVKAASYKMLADSFMHAGIATLRYDKRGIGASASSIKSEANMSFDDYVEDAIGFIKMLKNDSRFSKVFVLGHSEGSLIGIIAVGKEPVAGLISMAGLGEPADIIIEKQISTKSKELAGKAHVILDSLKKGYDVKNIDPDLKDIFHASLQPYIRSWIRYNPGSEIKKITEPILVVQGTTDIQVGTEEATLLKNASRYASLRIIEGMNHVLKQAPADRQKNMETYANPDLPLCPGLMQALVHFIKTPPPPGK